MSIVINGQKIAQKIEEELRPKLRGKSLSLGIILATKNPASEIYVQKKKKKAKELGIKTYLRKTKTEPETLKQIISWNKDPKITGIIVQLPLPQNFNKEKIIESIDPKKDIDGLTNFNQSLIFGGRTSNKGIIPATPLAAMAILDYYRINVRDKDVTVLGRSKLVGGPIAKLLKDKGARVKVGHSQTPDLLKITKNADIIISAVGKPDLVTNKMVKKNVFVIDIGADVDFENVAKIASFITPPSGGIGPVTVIKIMENVLKAYNLQNAKE